MMTRAFIFYCVIVTAAMAYANSHGIVFLHHLGFTGGSYGRAHGGQGYFFHAK